jgi:hypothetical protein
MNRRKFLGQAIHALGASNLSTLSLGGTLAFAQAVKEFRAIARQPRRRIDFRGGLDE